MSDAGPVADAVACGGGPAQGPATLGAVPLRTNGWPVPAGSPVPRGRIFASEGV